MNNQKHIFEVIKGKLPAGRALVDAIGETLHLSKDSAYRRIRGATALTFDESLILADAYSLSLDEFKAASDRGTIVRFHYESFSENILDYFNFIKKEFTTTASKDHHITYLAKDFPVIYSMMYPELAVFKAYFFAKFLWKFPVVDDVKFNFRTIYGWINSSGFDMGKLALELLENINSIKTIEIWNPNSFNGLISNIQYTWESGNFDSKESALMILERAKGLIEHLKKQSERGIRSLPDTKAEAELEVYFIDAVELEHTVLRHIDGDKKVYHLYNTGDYLITSDSTFTERSSNYIDNLLKKSTKISEVNEKRRNQAFTSYLRKFESLERKILEDGY